MLKQLLSTLSIAVISFLFITGCKKEKDNPPAPQTKTQLITQSSWKFQSANSSVLGDISANPLLACYIDNVMTFSSNLTGTINEGAVVCSTPAPANFTWAFQNSETTLHLSFTFFTGGSPDFTIVSLTGTNLVVSQQVNQAPYPSQTITLTFKH